MLYRTRHIFILLSGLLHLGIGSYFAYRLRAWRRAMQLVGSTLVTSSSVLFTIAFFYEAKLKELHTPLSHFGMYAIAIGALLHVISGVSET